jgi:hypothetical protein
MRWFIWCSMTGGTGWALPPLRLSQIVVLGLRAPSGPERSDTIAGKY